MAAADLDGKVQQTTDGTLDSSHCGWCILVSSYAMLLHSMLSASGTCIGACGQSGAACVHVFGAQLGADDYQPNKSGSSSLDTAWCVCTAFHI